MEKVFIVVESQSGGIEYSIEGVFSTKEKAELYVKSQQYIGYSFDLTIEEHDVDKKLENAISYLEQELKGYEECSTLLRELKEL